MHALGLEFGSAAQLSKRPGSVWNCLWGNALKRSPGIIRKSRVSYPGPGFLSSATWPLLPKKHYNGLNQTKAIQKIKQTVLSCHIDSIRLLIFLLKEKSSTHYVAIIHIEKRLDTIVNYLRQFVTKIVVSVSLKTILRVGHYLQTQTSIELKF